MWVLLTLVEEIEAGLAEFPTKVLEVVMEEKFNGVVILCR